MKILLKGKSLSLRSILFIVPVLCMLLSGFVIGYVIFSNWRASAWQTTEQLCANMNEEIYQKIDAFLKMPIQINDINYKLIRYGILDLQDAKARDRFFVSILSSQNKEIYSFSYGTASGEYYGARRNENGIIEVMRNNAATGGNSWYYSVNDDLTAGEIAVKAGPFDPRTRAWYQAAVTTRTPVFSSIYKHFIMSDLTISAAMPVYDDQGKLQGVMGTHLLLNGIGKYLEDTVKERHGYAFIMEKKNTALIANSLDIKNFAVSGDELKRYTVEDIDDPIISRVYQQYIKQYQTGQPVSFRVEGDQDNLFVTAREYHQNGLDWVIFSAVPESILMKEVFLNIRITSMLVFFSVLVMFVAYYFATRKLLRPMADLLIVSEKIADGNLTERAVISRNDEIGQLAEAFNHVAGKLHDLIGNLEETVQIRTAEMEASKDQLRLLLDSTAEAIYGIDTEGRCTFCNLSCINVLGYSCEEELLGQNMHQLIHHSKADETPLPDTECKIIQSILKGKGTHVNNEVFWRADGTHFDVEYFSYPQIRNGKVIGAVVTFMDTTERNRKQEEIEYLSCHDMLTGLKNRRCLEESLTKIDIPENLPLSIIFADLNGLKMTNDIFGHAAGDALIKKSSEILLQSCRAKDIVARVGGDEFIILLPGTNREETGEVITRIRNGFSSARIAAIKCSVSLGSDTKTLLAQSIEEIMANAEDEMYKDKTMNRKSVNKDIIITIIDTLHAKSPREKQHSQVVSQLSGQIGKMMNLPDNEIRKLQQAGYLHDIGKIVLDDNILRQGSLSDEDYEKMSQHAAVGYRILNLFDETLDLAEGVYCHHEKWDGQGYPKGLKGEEIPLLSRIIAIAEVYDRVLGRADDATLPNQIKALQEIINGAGSQFDPNIAALFIGMMENGIPE